MLCFPNAKINLGLNILNKRPDGFHNIETLFVPVYQYRDILEIVHSNKPAMVQYGLSYEGEPTDNLCYKAYLLMEKEFHISPVEIHLYKQIPVGAGLGGGSADAAFTLKALNTLFNLKLSDETLSQLAVELGSDCPFFIYNRPMLASGRGEILSKFEHIDLSNYEIHIISPQIHVSTKEAYSGIIPHKPKESLIDVLSQPIENWKNLLINDFEESVFAKHPELALLKDDLYKQGAIYASMSGSGSSLYGIFTK